MPASQPPPLTIGVEEELALVSAGDHHLVGRSADLIRRVPVDAQPFVEHEFKTSQVETVSPVCSTLDELEGHLAALRTQVSRSAGEMGCTVLASGTHPASRWQDQELTPEAAYVVLGSEYQRLAEEQLVFGCHVHVGIDDQDLRIAVLDRVRGWLSVLLALTANSPFWNGEDTGFASYRYIVFSRWPTFVTPGALGDWAGFKALVDELVRSEAIDSPQRLYWTVRPSNRFPTLEFRIADACTDLAETVMLAGLVRGLVSTAIGDVEAGRPAVALRGEIVRMAEWQAARYGLDGDLIDPIGGGTRPAVDAVRQLLDHVGPALDDHGDRERVTGTVDRILTEGNGAQRQRAAWRSAPGVVPLLESLTARGVSP
ncbi:carboxylate-amine ligase [Aquihabitans sp. McL0605]|uniref:carboxylate-amine ligase n=1 Tax=Aquihabitans sp. McL0605 TaxID=3415671 RepID=UPI003CF3401D